MEGAWIRVAPVMSLSQKFTWGDFLRQNPDLKAKKVKRTSPEGEKAFQAAFKKFAKDYLKEREAWIKKEEERVVEAKGKLVKTLKEVDGRKWRIKMKKLNKEIGRFDSYLSKISRWQEESKRVARKI